MKNVIRSIFLLAAMLVCGSGMAVSAEEKLAPEANLAMGASHMSKEWGTEYSRAFWAKDPLGQPYLFALDRMLWHKETYKWAWTMTLFGADKPFLFGWLNDEYGKDIALVLENGEVKIIKEGYIASEILDVDSKQPFGTLRVTAYDGTDTAVGVREFRTLLVPAPFVPAPAQSDPSVSTPPLPEPAFQCVLELKQPWESGEKILGTVERWICPTKGEHPMRIQGFSTGGRFPELIFQSWNSPSGERFAAMVFSDGEHVAGNTDDIHTGIFYDEKTKSVSVLLMEINGKVHRRVIPIDTP